MGIEFLVKRFMAIRSASLGRYSPADGCIYYLSDITGTYQLWRSCGGRHDIVVPWDRRVGDYVISSKGSLAFASDFDGDEKWAIYVYEGNDVWRIAGEDGSMNLLGAWSPDGKRLAYTSNARNGVDFDLYIYDAVRRESRLVYEGDGMIVPQAWIGDRVVSVKRNSNLDSDILVIDAETGKAENITKHEGEAENTNPVPVDSSRLLYITNHEREFKALSLYDLEKNSSRILFSPEGDVELVDYYEGTVIASVNSMGSSRIYRLRLGTDRAAQILGVYDGNWVVTSIHSEGGVTVLSASSPREGNEVYLLRERVERVTWSPKLGLEENFVEPRHFEYESFDGLRIHGLLYEPSKNRRVKTPYPAVLWLHGGPESQSRPSFNTLQQAMTSLGIGVVAPNFRGSTGYGKTFVHLDDLEKRINAVKDVYYAVKHLTSEGIIDPERLCVMGGSYGGYLTLMSLALYPDTWRCGVEIVGIVNLVTFIRNTSPYRRRYRIPEYGDPDKHADIMLELSPITHAHKIRAPLMVIHGANDPRVPLSEAKQIVETLKEKGVEVRYIELKDEGHGIAKIENRIKVYTEALKFLAEKLLDKREA
ncbi:MAG: S9 family peptidase [Desulfurococcales archaeon]|nr:S9 family peptidase [Desulfurococcales archaeon]